MDWPTFYLICFVVGLVFSLLSLAGGVGKVHLPARLHLPRGLTHGGARPLPIHLHGSHLGVASRAAGARAGTAARGSQASFFNLSSLMAFLAWFGGTGYLLTRYSNLWTSVAFVLALASGFTAAAVVFWFLAKVLLAHEANLDPADFELIGVLGKVNITIHAGGTGEVVFAQGGTRKVAGARSESADAIAKGTEVVITRYEKGIAYVRPWEELAGEHRLRSSAAERPI